MNLKRTLAVTAAVVGIGASAIAPAQASTGEENQMSPEACSKSQSASTFKFAIYYNSNYGGAYRNIGYSVWDFADERIGGARRAAPSRSISATAATGTSRASRTTRPPRRTSTRRTTRSCTSTRVTRATPTGSPRAPGGASSPTPTTTTPRSPGNRSDLCGTRLRIRGGLRRSPPEEAARFLFRAGAGPRPPRPGPIVTAPSGAEQSHASGQKQVEP